MKSMVSITNFSREAGRLAMTGRLAAVAALVAGSLLAQAPQYTIKTFAGNGARGFEGDGAAATGAKLSGPLGLAIDNSGNLYIADQFNHRIRKVSTGGTISTIAGKEVPGYTGDDGTATSATLNNPSGLAVDGSGNVYIADTKNNRVRKVATDGKITLFAGDGVAGFVERNSDGTYKEAKYAQLNSPTGLALDSSGNVYIADSLNHRIRKVGTDGKISTVAGTGVAGYTGDDGMATSATLNHPTAVAVGSGGSLYIADQQNHRIRKITPDGVIKSIAGTGLPGYSGNGGPASLAALFYPTGLAVDASGNVYVADMTNNRIRRIAEDGTITAIAGTGKFGDTGEDEPALNARIKFPTAVLAATGGKLYFSDSQNHRVKVLTPASDKPNAAGAPLIAEGGVGLAVEYGAARTIAPGAWIEITGSRLAGDAPAATRVTIDGQPAVVAEAGAERLKAQAPFGLSAGERQVVVATDSGRSEPYTVQVASAEPGLEARADLRVSERQWAAARIGGGAVLALPAGIVEGVETRPARAGETLLLSGTGFGVVTPFVEAGEAAQAGSTLVAPVRFELGGVEAQLVSAGLAEGKVGVYEFRIVVPQLAESGAAALTVTVDGRASGQTLSVAVER